MTHSNAKDRPAAGDETADDVGMMRPDAAGIDAVATAERAGALTVKTHGPEPPTDDDRAAGDPLASPETLAPLGQPDQLPLSFCAKCARPCWPVGKGFCPACRRIVKGATIRTKHPFDPTRFAIHFAGVKNQFNVQVPTEIRSIRTGASHDGSRNRTDRHPEPTTHDAGETRPR